MDYEKALNEFEAMLPMTDETEQYYSEILCAIECINKQIGKTVILDKKYGWNSCSSCGSWEVMSDVNLFSYCPHCGQKLYWEVK